MPVLATISSSRCSGLEPFLGRISTSPRLDWLPDRRPRRPTGGFWASALRRGLPGGGRESERIPHHTDEGTH